MVYKYVLNGLRWNITLNSSPVKYLQSIFDVRHSFNNPSKTLHMKLDLQFAPAPIQKYSNKTAKPCIIGVFVEMVYLSL